MSLELAIQDNTAALRELIARLTTPGAVTMTAAEYVANLDKPVATTAVETKAESAGVSGETTAAVTKSEKVAQVAATLVYEQDVRPVLIKISTTKGRDALVSLLKAFGVTKGDQLAPEQFGEVLAAADKVLGA